MEEVEEKKEEPKPESADADGEEPAVVVANGEVKAETGAENGAVDADVKGKAEGNAEGKEEAAVVKGMCMAGSPKQRLLFDMVSCLREVLRDCHHLALLTARISNSMEISQ